MKKLSSEFIVGISVIIAIAIGYFGYQILKGKNIFRNEIYVYTIIDKVEDLAIGSKVLAKGFEVGIVEEISNTDLDLNNFLIKIKLNSLYHIPKNSIIRVKKSLLDNSELVITFGNSKKNLQANDTLIEGKVLGFSQQFLESKEDNDAIKLGLSILDELNIITQNIRKMLDKSTINHIKFTLENLDKTSKNVAELSEKFNVSYKNTYPQIERTIKNLEKITSTLASQDSAFSNSFSNIEQITAEIKDVNFKQLIDSTQLAINALKHFSQKFDNPNNAIQKLTNDEKFANRLDSLTTHLDNLIIDIKANPRRYIKIDVFGGKKKR